MEEETKKVPLQKNGKPATERQIATRFKKGQVANPKGRPRGKSLKEFAREMLMALPDEQKLAFLKRMPEQTVWMMAEGLPSRDTNLTVSATPIPIDDVTSDVKVLPEGKIKDDVRTMSVVRTLEL